MQHVYNVDPRHQKNLDILAGIAFARHLIHFFENTLETVIEKMFTLEALNAAAGLTAQLKMQNVQLHSSLQVLSGHLEAFHIIADTQAVLARPEGLIPEHPIPEAPNVHTRQHIIHEALTYASIQLHNSLCHVLPLPSESQDPLYTFSVSIDPQNFILKFFRGGRINGFYMAPIARNDGFEITSVKVEGSYDFQAFTYQKYISLVKAEINHDASSLLGMQTSQQNIFPTELLEHIVNSDPVLRTHYQRMTEEGLENDYFTPETFRKSFKDESISRIIR